MAKATEEDMKAALLLNGILDDVDDGNFPRPIDGGEGENDPDYFDAADIGHLKAFHERVMHCVRLRPSGISRVIWGFATIADNNILDPDKNVLELHPRFKELPQDQASIEERKRIERTANTLANFAIDNSAVTVTAADMDDLRRAITGQPTSGLRDPNEVRQELMKRA